MENAENLTRLKYEQDRVLQSNEECRKVRQKLKDDYLAVQKRLETLPDQITENVVVPVGKVAFFPGHLIHTNEILVLLGDNWFVERSAKQACEIIQRRIKLVEHQLEELKKEETNVSAQKAYTHDFHKEVSEVKEIQEKVPDDGSLPPRKGRQRKAHAAKHDIVPRSVTFKDNTEVVNELAHSNSDTIDHDELFARLNQLEKEEQEEEDRLHEEHMNEILSGKYIPTRRKSTPAHDDEPTRRHVKFKNDEMSSLLYDSDDEAGENGSGDGNCIQFTHTPHQPQRERSASESDLRTTFKTPADLYDHFSSKNSKSFEEVYPGDKQPVLKSILKKDSRSNSNENLKLKPILKTSPEHQPGTPEQVSFDQDTRPLDPRPILKTPPDTQGSERRPGTPEYTLSDDPKPILKSNFTVLPSSCLSDGEATDPRPILKSMEEDAYNSESESEELTRPTILKTSNDHVRSNGKVGGNDNVRFNDNVGLNENGRFNDNVGINDNVRFNDNVGINDNVRFNDNVGLNENGRFNDNVGINDNVRFNDNVGLNENGRFNDSTQNMGKSPTEGSGRKTILKNAGNEMSGVDGRYLECTPNVGIADRVVEREGNHENALPDVTPSRRPVSRFKASRSQNKK